MTASLPVRRRYVDGPFGQLLERTDDLVDADPPGLGLGYGDLLDGVLQLDAGCFQLLDEIGPVQEFERRRPLSGQPVVQQPADPLTGVTGIEVGRTDTERGVVFGRLLLLGPLGRTLVQDRDGGELAGLLVKDFLAHPDRGDAALRELLLGGSQRARTILGRHVQGPSGPGLASHEDLVVDLSPHDAVMPGKTLRPRLRCFRPIDATLSAEFPATGRRLR